MNLKHLNDQELLSQTRQLVQNERKLLTQILHHLREVEKRKLFSDLGYQSLFEYAVKELKYSEGQAGRRIQAMRLIREIPELEVKIKTGSLSLSNVSQAQSYFREVKKSKPEEKLEQKEKLKILECLENKSAREGQKILLTLQPKALLPKEKERILTETHTEVRFVMEAQLKEQLEEIRSLLGIKGAAMNMAELIEYMAGVSLQQLKIKKFGKKRVLGNGSENKRHFKNNSKFEQRSLTTAKSTPTPTSEFKPQPNPRYISKKLQHQIWTRDQARCTRCGSRRNLNIDHIQPVALGGSSHFNNLRLLCFHCNQRQAMKTFGVGQVEFYQHVGER